MPSDTRILQSITIVRRSNGTYAVFDARGGGYSCGSGGLRGAIGAVLLLVDVRGALHEAIDLAIDAYGLEPDEIVAMVDEVTKDVARREAELDEGEGECSED